MGNLRPAPAELTPQRIDSLFAALDAKERAYTEITLRRLGLPDADIAAVFALAKQIGRHPLATAGGLVGSSLDALERRG